VIAPAYTYDDYAYSDDYYAYGPGSACSVVATGQRKLDG